MPRAISAEDARAAGLRHGEKFILVPTADMSADMLTKPLDDRTFHKHRREVMNLPA